MEEEREGEEEEVEGEEKEKEKAAVLAATFGSYHGLHKNQFEMNH